MPEQSDYPFKGLSKIKKLGDEKYSFRLYPWAFSNDPTAKDVCEITFDATNLDAEINCKFQGNEVDVEFTDKTISMFDWDLGDEFSFLASLISQRMVCYELSDFVDRVFVSESALKKEYRSNTDGKRKLAELRSLANELLRRAEIKAVSSKEQSKFQQSTIKAINRIKTALEEDDN